MVVARVVVITILAIATGCDDGDDSAGTNRPRPIVVDRPVPTPSAHCQEVAEALTTLDLGNYAPKDKRGMRVATVLAMCERERVTRDEADCLLAKKTKPELAICPKPLLVKHLSKADFDAQQSKLPPSCQAYIALLERYTTWKAVPDSARQGIRDALEMMKREWSKAGLGSGGPSMQSSIDQACASGLDSMRSAMATMGC
jgi:hypothetical protein